MVSAKVHSQLKGQFLWDMQQEIQVRIIKIIFVFHLFCAVSCTSEYQVPDFDSALLINKMSDINCGVNELLLKDEQLLFIQEELENSLILSSRLNHASYWKISILLHSNSTRINKIDLHFMLTNELVFSLYGKYFVNDELAKYIISELEVKTISKNNNLCKLYEHLKVVKGYMSNNVLKDGNFYYNLGVLSEAFLKKNPTSSLESDITNTDSLIIFFEQWLDSQNQFVTN